MFYDNVLIEYHRLEKEISLLQNKLKSFPDGKLICVHNGKHYKWFQSDGHTSLYIPKKERKFAEQLAIKKYLLTLLKQYQHEKNAIEFYLRHHNTNTFHPETLLQDTSGYSELLQPHFRPISDQLTEWMQAPFKKNPYHSDSLIHKTVSGNLVRSKSEALIDMLLFMHKIPFRYECALALGETTLYPDFTIRHPATGEYYYWEHFGLMDDSFYIQNTCSKLQLYSMHGIIPSIHLITTYETQKNPLTSDTIEKIIDHYFLQT